MTLESLQLLSNWLSTITLLGFAVWCNGKDKLNRVVKGILLIIGMLGFFNIILNL